MVTQWAEHKHITLHLSADIGYTYTDLGTLIDRIDSPRQLDQQSYLTQVYSSIEYTWSNSFVPGLVGVTDSVMMTSSNGNIFRVTGPVCGEFTGPGEFPAQRPVTRNFDVFFDLRLNKRLSK